MDRVLVATDFSTRSDRALRRASLIARKLGASLQLVHVVDGDRPGMLIDSDRTAATGFLEEITATLRDHDGFEADFFIKVADVADGILTAAEELAADLIVIGPHRRRLRDIFIGTTAERVVQRSAYPLLVAVESPAAQYRRTLLALDFDDASKQAGRDALAIGLFDYTEVVVMHAFDAPAEGMMRRSLEEATVVDQYVADEGEAAADQLRALVAELELPPACQTVVSMKGSPARTILESALNVDADLLVLGANKRAGLERLLVGSVTADVIRDAHRDVLIIPVAATD